MCFIEGQVLSPLTSRMASRVPWDCQLCGTGYSCLFDLVSHVRAAHSVEVSLNFVCQINGCPRMFKRTNTWYKHVIQSHREEYTKNVCYEDLNDDLQCSDQDHIESPRDEAGPEGSDTDLPSPSTSHVCSTLMSEEMIAGKLLRIREKHLVSHAVIDEVVELVEGVCLDISTKALSKIRKLGEESGIDTSLPFFLELPEIFEKFSSPLASIRTAYKQQSFIAKNLPYVVSTSISSFIYHPHN